MHSRLFALPLFLATLAAACGGGPAPAPTSQEQPASATLPAVDPATAATISGTVSFEGTAPANASIRMNADPYCLTANKTPQTQETYMVKDGLGNYVFDTPTETAKIDQQNCRYHPHVFGMRVGQSLEILNSDPTLHNIHAQPKNNSEFNNGQPIQGMKMSHTFDKPEIMVPFKCDVHGWMNAYVGVLNHPYFAVTDKDGKFELKSLPPGTYTIEAWHEKLGTQTASVTLGAKESKDVTFTFKAAGATATN